MPKHLEMALHFVCTKIIQWTYPNFRNKNSNPISIKPTLCLTYQPSKRSIFQTFINLSQNNLGTFKFKSGHKPKYKSIIVIGRIKIIFRTRLHKIQTRFNSYNLSFQREANYPNSIQNSPETKPTILASHIITNTDM